MSRTLPNDPQIIIVDHNNEIIGTEYLEAACQKGYWHRVCYVFVYIPQEKVFLVRKRPKDAQFWPGFYDICNGRVRYETDSSDLEAAERGVSETFGVPLQYFGPTRSDPAHLSFVHTIKNEEYKVFINVYFFKFDGQMHLTEDQLSLLTVWSLEQINDKVFSNTEKITEMSKFAYLESTKNDEFLARIFDPDFDSENEEK